MTHDGKDSGAIFKDFADVSCLQAIFCLLTAACVGFSGFCESDSNFLPFFFLIIAVADDSTHHVSTLCVGPAEQRHDCIVLVWNKI